MSLLMDLDSLKHYSPKPVNGYRNIAKPVVFLLRAPAAKRVTLMGDFNDWNPNSDPMKRLPDGGWRYELPLNHGHHHYLFCVDGSPTLDPRSQGIASSHKHDKVSLIAVS